MEIIFTLPDIGNLMLEHTFYMYEEPILFVCKDGADNRYLCSCCRLSEQWVVAQVTEAELVQLIENKVTIRELFESHAKMKCLVTWDGVSDTMDSAVPSALLPKTGAMLDLDYENGGAYYKTLKIVAWQKGFFKALSRANSAIYKSYTSYFQATAPLTKEIEKMQEIMAPLLKEYNDISRVYRETLSDLSPTPRTSEMDDALNTVKAGILSHQLQAARQPKSAEPVRQQQGVDLDISYIAA